MSCRWHGSSCIQCHFLRSCGWQSLPKWHCNSQSTVARCWGCVCCRSWALLQWKSSFARVPGCSAHGPAGACSKSRSNSCISLVGHHHLHITSGGWSLSQYCLLSVCPSLIMSKHWNCDSSVLLFHHFQEANIRTACTCTVPLLQGSVAAAGLQ